MGETWRCGLRPVGAIGAYAPEGRRNKKGRGDGEVLKVELGMRNRGDEGTGRWGGRWNESDRAHRAWRIA